MCVWTQIAMVTPCSPKVHPKFTQCPLNADGDRHYNLKIFFAISRILLIYLSSGSSLLISRISSVIVSTLVWNIPFKFVYCNTEKLGEIFVTREIMSSVVNYVFDWKNELILTSFCVHTILSMSFCFTKTIPDGWWSFNCTS